MDNKAILEGMKLFLKSEEIEVEPEIYSDIVMCSFGGVLLKTPVSVKINCSSEDPVGAPYLKIWLDLDIQVKDEQKISSYNEIRKIINHANRNNVIGKVWIEEYCPARGNIRWSTCQFLSEGLKKTDIEKSISNLYNAGIEELALWVKPFISVAAQTADAVTAIKKAKIDIEPFDLEKNLEK